VRAGFILREVANHDSESENWIWENVGLGDDTTMMLCRNSDTLQKRLILQSLLSVDIRLEFEMR